MTFSCDTLDMCTERTLRWLGADEMFENPEGLWSVVLGVSGFWVLELLSSLGIGALGTYLIMF